MQLEIGKTYKICIEVSDDDATSKPKMKFVPAKLIKEVPNFWLFQTKHYKTTMHKADFRLIKEG